MKNKELARTLKFILFSASAGIIETVAMILCEEVIKIPGHYVCYTIALVLSILWNFTFNRKFTFQSAANVPKAMALVFLFYIPFAPFTIWLEHILADVNGWNEYVVLAINMSLNLSLEYLWDNFVVYRDSKDTNDIAKKKAEKESLEEKQARIAEIIAEVQQMRADGYCFAWDEKSPEEKAARIAEIVAEAEQESVMA